MRRSRNAGPRRPAGTMTTKKRTSRTATSRTKTTSDHQGRMSSRGGWADVAQTALWFPWRVGRNGDWQASAKVSSGTHRTRCVVRVYGAGLYRGGEQSCRCQPKRSSANISANGLLQDGQRGSQASAVPSVDQLRILKLIYWIRG